MEYLGPDPLPRSAATADPTEPDNPDTHIYWDEFSSIVESAFDIRDGDDWPLPIDDDDEFLNFQWYMYDTLRPFV